ncbi:redoxin domain-containing protein [bacterium]|nr:redoxin domain-containing protein [bacterium]
MKMLSFLFSTFLICLFLIIEEEAVTVAVQRDDSSQMVYYGEPVFIQIDPSKLNYIESPQDISQLQLFVYAHLLDTPEMIDMKKRNGIWEAVYTLTDTSVKMLMFTVQVEVSEKQSIIGSQNVFQDMLVYDEANRPVQGAHQARALSYTGLGGLRNEDLDLAVQEIEKELELYPDNLSARNLFYTLLLKANNYSSRIRNQIKREIDEMLYRNPTDENTMNFAIGGYRLIGEMDVAQKVEDDLIEQNPKGNQASVKTFDEIMQIENTEDRAQRLDGFLVAFPESPLMELALSNLASAVIELDDLARLTDIGDRLLYASTTPTAASGLAGIAGVLSEKQIELNRASAYIDRALTLIRSSTLSMEPPPEMTEKEWEERIHLTEARYRDILGWIHFQQGKIESSITELRKAAEETSQPGVYYHLAEALNASGNTDEAILYYARAAAFDGEIADNAYDKFTDHWLQFKPETEDMDLFYRQQKEWIDNHYRDNVLSQRINRRAPDFELSSLRNERIKLSDQKRSVVLLCFWATWSTSSEMLLETLKLLYENLGQKVLFLTIAVDMDESDIRDYVIEHRIALPVLFNDGTDEDYQLQGVPTLFLIDQNGEIQFEHKGYRSDIERLLMIEAEYLLASR